MQSTFKVMEAPDLCQSLSRGRISREQLKKFRQEVSGEGLSSYPHPRLMPDFWEYLPSPWGWGHWRSSSRKILEIPTQQRFGRYIRLPSVLVPW